MDGQRFDAIAKAMAGGATRRRALRLAGGGLAGALLAAAGLGRRAGAQGSSACAHFCTEVFPPGRERGECESAAAQGIQGNLCAACGADPTNACAAADGTVTCCDATETCVNGQCAVTCPVGGFCRGATSRGCPGGCVCTTTTEGQAVCAQNIGCAATRCSSTSECPAGSVCVDIDRRFCSCGGPEIRLCFPTTCA